MAQDLMIQKNLRKEVFLYLSAGLNAFQALNPYRKSVGSYVFFDGSSRRGGYAMHEHESLSSQHGGKGRVEEGGRLPVTFSATAQAPGPGYPR